MDLIMDIMRKRIKQITIRRLPRYVQFDFKISPFHWGLILKPWDFIIHYSLLMLKLPFSIKLL
jgi:hypothetical protein